MARLYSPEERGVPKKLIDATLRWCNKMRKKDGKKPLAKLPRGVPHDAQSCPCGTATGLLVYTEYATRLNKTTRTGSILVLPMEEMVCELPLGVQHFVERFDMGKDDL